MQEAATLHHSITAAAPAMWLQEGEHVLHLLAGVVAQQPAGNVQVLALAEASSREGARILGQVLLDATQDARPVNSVLLKPAGE
jgi:hypothetical protein